MLEVRNLVKRYPIGKSKKKFVTALNNVSITFPEKGLIFLLGKSGSGKSTLLNAIGGLDTFDSGEIIIKGKSSKDFKQSDFDSYRNTFVGFIFQEYNVLEEFTVAKNLSLAIELQGKHPSKEMVDDLLRTVEMQEFAKRKPNQLSGGQKQRIAIARALIKNPEIIMADEPTGALDSNTGKQVMDTLKNLSKEKLVIIVSHDREFAEIYGDRIVELKDGKIIRDVTKKEVTPEKTVSGVSFIDNEIIHIKKGQSLTQDDLNRICKSIMLNAQENDTIISLSPSANVEVKKATNITDNGNREVFKETLPADVETKQYSGNYKMIKSKLKFKDSFKMGASALKNKVGKLVFTIMLSFIAFGMFGIIDTFSSFDRAKAINATIQEHNSKVVSLLKEKEGEYSNDTFAFQDSDIKALKEKYPDIEFKKIVNSGIRFGSSYYSNYSENSLYFQGLNSNQSSVLKTAFHSGMLYVKDTEELQSMGINLLAGRLPSAYNEICITKRQFDVISAENEDKNLTYAKMLSDYSICELRNSPTCKIVGIIDDGKDWSKYDNMSTQEISADYMLQTQIARELSFGFSNILLVSEAKYHEYFNTPNEMYLEIAKDGEHLAGFYTDEFSEWDTSYLKEKFSSAEWFASNYVYHKTSSVCDMTFANGSAFIALPSRDIILHESTFDNVFGTSDSASRQSKLSSETPLTVVLQTKASGASDYSSVATYNVVGYHTAYNCGSANIASLETIAEFETLTDGKSVKFTSGASSVTTSFTTLEEVYLGYYSSSYDVESFVSNKVGYYKNGASLVDNGALKSLGLNEIILGEGNLSQLGSGQELYDMIDAGLTIDYCLDYEGKNVLFSLTVVGVTSSGSSYISKETFESLKKEYLGGFSYAIALLSSDADINKQFIEECETFNEKGYKYTVQLGATPILDQFGDMFASMAEVFLYIGIGFAVFAALLLMNFITTSISYKKREIGILRALGARGSDVFGIFFNESLVIALINFVLATITTFVVCAILNSVIITKLGLDLVLLSVGIRQVLLMLGASVLTAFISSFIPVMKIAHKKPIDAINNR